MIKHVHFVRKHLSDGGTRWHVYAWRGGPKVASFDGRKKPTLDAGAVKRIAELVQDRSAPNPSTLLFLIRKWRSNNPDRPSSPEWERLAANTKKTWGSALDRIEEKWGSVPLAVFDDTRMTSKVIDWRDSRIATPRAADVGVDVLRALLKYGVQRGVLRFNAAVGVGKVYAGGQRAEIILTEEDLVLFSETAASLGMSDVADAVQFGAVTGLRREDLVTITWKAVGKFAVVKKASKRSRGRRRFATMPRIPQLDDVLDRLQLRPRTEGVETVLVTAKGQPWHPDTLTKKVAKVLRHAGIIHVEEDGTRRSKHLHDVRGTFATKLMTTTDLTEQEIADIMAWSPEEVSRIRRMYVADDARMVAIGRRIAQEL